MFPFCLLHLENRMTVCMGYTAMTPKWGSRNSFRLSLHCSRQAVHSGQLVWSKSAEGCGSPAATSKGHRPFEAPTEPTGETNSLRGSRAAALPSDMMLCVISYWVLSGAKRRQIQQLRCCVLLAKLLKRRLEKSFIVRLFTYNK